MIGRLCRALADLLFPRECIVCKTELLLHEKHLCCKCMAEMPFTYFWNFANNQALKAFYGRVYLESAFSLIYYTNSYKSLIHSLKYRSNVESGLWLGEMLGEKIASSVFACDRKIDFIIPVPLHWRKKWKRGFNQSAVIANGIRKGLIRAENGSENIKKSGRNPSGVQIIENIVKRRTYTNTQTHKDRISRWKNVEQAFALNECIAKRYDLNGKHLLIVDDVLTTGATIEACCNILLKKYNCKISVATIACVE